MEAIGSYLLQMACWLAAFWLVYVLALRKETFFELNRWFLLVGIMAAFVLPLFPIKYEVVKNTADSTLLLMTGKLSETSTPFEDSISYWYWIYGIGAFIVFARFLHQCIKLLWLIRKSEPIWVNNTRVFKFEGDTAPFSFFNFIFVSKTMDNEAELKTVVANALSFFGKYSAMAFIDAGKFPASPIARTKRAKINKVTLKETIAPTSPTVEMMFLASEKLPVH